MRALIIIKMSFIVIDVYLSAVCSVMMFQVSFWFLSSCYHWSSPCFPWSAVQWRAVWCFHSELMLSPCPASSLLIIDRYVQLALMKLSFVVIMVGQNISKISLRHLVWKVSCWCLTFVLFSIFRHLLSYNSRLLLQWQGRICFEMAFTFLSVSPSVVTNCQDM